MDGIDALIQLAGLVGIGLLLLAGAIAVFERDSDAKSRFVIKDGKIRLRSSVEREEIAVENERIDRMRKRLEHPGFIGWQEEWPWLRS